MERTAMLLKLIISQAISKLFDHVEEYFRFILSEEYFPKRPCYYYLLTEHPFVEVCV